MANFPLDDIRIVELALTDSAAAAGSILTDLGADVVKVLRPDAPDPEDLAIRLHERGKALARLEPTATVDLVSRADVFVTDYGQSELAAMGLDRHSCAGFSQLIHAHISPFGYDAVMPRPSDDAAFYTRSGTVGMMSDTQPLRFGRGQGARSAAFALTAAIVTQLLRRDRTGRADPVESTLVGAGLFSVSNDVTVVQASAAQPSRYDRKEPLNALGNSYLCADDEWLLLGVASASDAWAKFRNIVDDSAWMDDADFATDRDRRKNVRALVQALEHEFYRHPRAEWGRRLNAIGINWNPIANAADVIHDPQVTACGTLMADGRLRSPLTFGHEVRPSSADPEDSAIASWLRPFSDTWTQHSKLQARDDNDLPLAGMRAVDTSHYVAGPALGALLVDLGADVIKVEPPGGDPRRGALPHLVAGDPPGLNRSYHMDNRGKRSIEVDFSDAGQLNELKTLVAHADIFLTNLLPGRQRRYGLDSGSLFATNPNLVYASLTAHGSRGPDADLGGFDLTAFFARSGILGGLTSQMGVPPRSRSGQGDHIATLVLLTGLLAAVRLRQRTDEPQRVETSLLAVGTYTIGDELLRTQLGMPIDDSSPLDTFYRTRDGRWLRLCDATASVDQLLRLTGARSTNALNEAFAERDLDAWRQILSTAGIAACAVPEMPDVLADSDVQAIGVLSTINVPDIGAIGTVRAPYVCHGWNTQELRAGPSVGEHTTQIRAEIHKLAH